MTKLDLIAIMTAGAMPAAFVLCGWIVARQKEYKLPKWIVVLAGFVFLYVSFVLYSYIEPIIGSWF